jgi:hypothetical protein
MRKAMFHVLAQKIASVFFILFPSSLDSSFVAAAGVSAAFFFFSFSLK